MFTDPYKTLGRVRTLVGCLLLRVFTAEGEIRVFTDGCLLIRVFTAKGEIDT